jgi:hypothetical protein
MTQTTVPPARVGARALAFVVVVLAALALANACAETKHSLGDACLKSEDCLSGICSQLVCVGAPTYISDEPSAESGAGEDASVSDSTAEAAPEAAPVEAASEASSGEAAAEAATD